MPFGRTNFFSGSQSGASFFGGAVSKYSDKQFWVDTFDRAVATFAQSLAGVLAVDKVGLFTVDWVGTLSVAGAITAASVLTSIAFRGNTPKPAPAEEA